ncbi:hypothetical protein L1887_32184 [Cichorium endivia]|nr:hypothetical protein L1887_32184 [Cichorium endivia]
MGTPRDQYPTSYTYKSSSFHQGGILLYPKTISGVCPSTSCLGILSKTPNLRKLGFHGPLVSVSGLLEFPNITSLSCLKALKLSNTKMYHSTVKSCSRVMFPERLTRLTLSNTALNWNEIRIIGKLPNLEALKLNVNACIGQRWETSDTGFINLKFLKLQDLDIVKWEASSSHFPRLERLVIRRCSRLEEIPTGIGEILTLELIEVSWCTELSAQSARAIQKEQERNGNDFLKVFTSVHRDLQGKRKRPSKKTLWKHNVYGLTPNVASAHSLLLYAKEHKDVDLMLDVMKLLKANDVPLQPGTADIVFRWELMCKYAKRFVNAGVNLRRTSFDTWMTFAAKLGDVDNSWKIEKLRSEIMKTHTIGSGFSCAKGFLLQHKPEEAAKIIQVVTQTLPEAKRPDIMAELEKMVSEWPLEVIKHGKDEDKMIDIRNVITLKPGEAWKVRQELSDVPSSYCSGQLDPNKVLQSS